MTNVAITQNAASGIAGVLNKARASMHNVTFDGNQFGDNDGAVLFQFEAAAVTNMTNITFTANESVSGGSYYAPISLWSGKLTMTNFLFADNTGDSGGDIFTSIGTELSLRDGTFDSNTAHDGGGAIAAQGGKVDIVNTTFHHNVSAGDGGVLQVRPYGSASAQIFLTNTTFFSNSAAGAGAVAWVFGPSSTVSFVNTLFDDNEPGDDCVFTNGASGTGHHNLTTDASCGFTLSADPGLSAFGSFGGFAPTAPLLPDSPAVDAADPDACPATDQRGLPRLGACDIGAAEAFFALSVVSGAPQSTTANSAFSQPLVVRYAGPFGEPFSPGMLITLTAPGSGASLSPSALITGFANAAGLLTSTLAANALLGAFDVTIAAQRIAAPITARLTNLGIPSTPTSTPTPSPTPTPIPAAAYVSPRSGAPTTNTVSIISPAGGLTGAAGVYVKGVKMFHVVRTDRKIDFTMRQSVAVAGTTVDVVLVKAGGTVMTFTQSYTFVAPTTVTGTTAGGAVLTTTTGVTITVPPQTALRPAAPQIAGTLVITYAQVDTPAEPPGDVPLSFFEVSVDVDSVGVSTLTNPATLKLPVDPAHVPAGQIARLFEWTAASSSWSLVADQSYDPVTGLVTAPIHRLGAYVLATAAASQRWFPTITLE